MPGIPKNPTSLIPLLRAAAAAVPTAPSWSPAAPTILEMEAAANDLAALDTEIEAIEDLLRIKRENRRIKGAQAYEMMQRVDEFTSLLYGAASAQKTPFGVEPAGGGASPGTLPKLVIVVIRDGVLPGSIFVDFSPFAGAHYEIQWSTSSDFNPVLGSKSATASEAQIDGLTKGTEYWVRVRAVKASQSGPWSDPAHRVANV